MKGYHQETNNYIINFEQKNPTAERLQWGLILKVVKKDSLRLFANVSKDTSIDIEDVTIDCIGSLG